MKVKRLESLHQIPRHAWALFILTVIPAAAICVKVAYSKPAYQIDLILLFVLGVAALLLARATPVGAVFLYCVWVLLPVGGMLKQYQEAGGDFSIFQAAPLLGVGLVAVLARNLCTTIIYGFIAFSASIIYGVICHDIGQGGSVAIFTALATWLAIAQLRKEQKVQERVQRLVRDTGELRGMVSNINQKWETLNYDP